MSDTVEGRVYWWRGDETFSALPRQYSVTSSTRDRQAHELNRLDVAMSTISPSLYCLCHHPCHLHLVLFILIFLSH